LRMLNVPLSIRLTEATRQEVRKHYFSSASMSMCVPIHRWVSDRWPLSARELSRERHRVQNRPRSRSLARCSGKRSVFFPGSVTIVSENPSLSAMGRCPASHPSPLHTVVLSLSCRAARLLVIPVQTHYLPPPLYCSSAVPYSWVFRNGDHCLVFVGGLFR